MGDFAALAGFLDSAVGSIGVSDDDGPVDERTKPARGSALCQRQHDVLHLSAGLGVEDVCVFGDDGGPSAVDESIGEGLMGRGEFIVEVDGFLDAAPGGDGGDIECGRDFRGGHAMRVIGDQGMQQVWVEAAVGGVGSTAEFGQGVDNAGNVAGPPWFGELGEQGDLQAGDVGEQTFSAADRVQQVGRGELCGIDIGQCGQRHWPGR